MEENLLSIWMAVNWKGAGPPKNHVNRANGCYRDIANGEPWQEYRAKSFKF